MKKKEDAEARAKRLAAAEDSDEALARRLAAAEADDSDCVMIAEPVAKGKKKAAGTRAKVVSSFLLLTVLFY
jgi:hypothetical protein